MVLFDDLPGRTGRRDRGINSDGIVCCLCSVDGRTYDITDFVETHPGGVKLLLRHHGRDATSSFDSYDHSNHAHKRMRQHLHFDYVTHMGRPGAPTFAIMALPIKWTIARELSNMYGKVSPHVKNYALDAYDFCVDTILEIAEATYLDVALTRALERVPQPVRDGIVERAGRLATKARALAARAYVVRRKLAGGVTCSVVVFLYFYDFETLFRMFYICFVVVLLTYGIVVSAQPVPKPSEQARKYTRAHLTK